MVEAGIEEAYNTKSLQWDSGDLREDAVDPRPINEGDGKDRNSLGLQDWRGLYPPIEGFVDCGFSVRGTVAQGFFGQRRR